MCGRARLGACALFFLLARAGAHARTCWKGSATRDSSGQASWFCPVPRRVPLRSRPSHVRVTSGSRGRGAPLVSVPYMRPANGAAAAAAAAAAVVVAAAAEAHLICHEPDARRLQRRKVPRRGGGGGSGPAGAGRRGNRRAVGREGKEELVGVDVQQPSQAAGGGVEQRQLRVELLPDRAAVRSIQLNSHC